MYRAPARRRCVVQRSRVGQKLARSPSRDDDPVTLVLIRYQSWLPLALDRFLHRSLLMFQVIRQFHGVSRAAITAAVGLLAVGLMTALAQEPPRPPMEVPYLNYPPGTTVPAIPAGPNATAHPP